MDVDGSTITEEVVSPHVLKQLLAFEDASGPSRQLDEQVVLLGSQAHHVTVQPDLALGRLDDEIAEIQDLFLLVRRGGAGSPQYRLDTRHQLPGHERLGHVIVGADLQTDDLILIALARRQHDYGDITHPADLATDLPAVDVRQHDVQNDKSRRLLGHQLQRLCAAARADGGVSLPLQVHGYQ